jgi:isoquinoline 1-oxidoreductase beta subunit
MIQHNLSLTRRSFLAGVSTAVGAALIVPLQLPKAQAQPAQGGPLPQSFIRIDTSGQVTFLLPTCEMGQGTHTGQAQILAEELVRTGQASSWTCRSSRQPPTGFP